MTELEFAKERHEEVEIIKKELLENIVEDLLTLKENHAHIDNEFAHDIANLINEYEEIY